MYTATAQLIRHRNENRKYSRVKCTRIDLSKDDSFTSIIRISIDLETYVLNLDNA